MTLGVLSTVWSDDDFSSREEHIIRGCGSSETTNLYADEEESYPDNQAFYRKDRY